MIGFRTIFLLMALSAGSPMAANAEAKSPAYEGGYIMSAYMSCPVTATYGSMWEFVKYQGSKEYNRGYAAFSAALKNTSRPSKLCFDAARLSGFFTVR